MSINIMDQFKGLLTDQVLGHVSGLVGGDAGLLAKGLEAAGGSVLGSIIDKASNRDVAASIFNSLGDGSVLNNIVGGLTENSTMLTTGLSLAKSLLGDKSDNVLDMIGTAAGISSDKSGTLLGLAGSLVAGLLGKQKAQGLGLDGFMSLLAGQGSILDKLLPNLGGVLGLGSFSAVASGLAGQAANAVSGAATQVAGAASGAASQAASAATNAAGMAGNTAKAGGSFIGKLLPWAVFALAAFAIISLLRGCNPVEKAGDAVSGAASAVTDAADATVNAAGAVTDAAASTVDSAVDGAAKLAGDAADATANAAGAVTDAAASTVDSAVDGAAKLAGDAADATANAAGAVTDAAASTVDNAVDGAAKLAGDAADATANAAGAVTDAAVGAVDGAAKLAGGAADATANAAGAVTDAAAGAADAVADGAGSVVDAGKSLLNAFGKKVGSLFSFKLPNGQAIDIPKGGFEESFANALSKGLKPGEYYDFDRLFFATGSSALTEDSMAQISDTASILKAYPDVNIMLRGHTDSTGNANANQRLSAARADAVKNALIAKGVAGTRINTSGVASSYPAATNDTAEGRQRNRRIDISAFTK